MWLGKTDPFILGMNNRKDAAGFLQKYKSSSTPQKYVAMLGALVVHWLHVGSKSFSYNA